VVACDPQTSSFNATVTAVDADRICLRSTKSSDAPSLAFGKERCFPLPSPGVADVQVGDCVRVVSDNFTDGEERELVKVTLDKGGCG